MSGARKPAASRVPAPAASWDGYRVRGWAWRGHDAEAIEVAWDASVADGAAEALSTELRAADPAAVSLSHLADLAREAAEGRFTVRALTLGNGAPLGGRTYRLWLVRPDRRPRSA